MWGSPVLDLLLRSAGAAAAPAALVDYVIKMGSGATTTTAPVNATINAADAYQTTRSGLAFGLPSGGGTDSPTGGIQGGVLGSRGGSYLNLGAGSPVRVLLPNGTFTVEGLFGTNFTGVTPGISILNFSNSAVLHAMSAATPADTPLDITGVQRTAAGWDANKGTVSITVSGGQGISFTRGAGSGFFCSYLRFQQTA